MSSEILSRKRKVRPWAEAARLVLNSHEALPICEIYERIKQQGLRDTTPGSKECLFSMMRAHSRGQHSMFYRKIDSGPKQICFGLRSDLPPSAIIIETDADTDDESQKHDSRFKPKIQLLKDQHISEVSENVAPQQTTVTKTNITNAIPSSPSSPTSVPSSVPTTAPISTTSSSSSSSSPSPPSATQSQNATVKRKSSTSTSCSSSGTSVPDEPPAKRCLRPKPTRVSDDRSLSSSGIDADIATSSSPVNTNGNTSTPSRTWSPSSLSSSSSIANSAAQDESRNDKTPPPISAQSFGCQPSPLTAAQVRSPAELQTILVASRRGASKFLTMREMLASLSESCGIKLNKRPPKKCTLSQQLEETKKGCIDLESPESILSSVNIRELLSSHTFELLPPEYQRSLILMLPEVDREPSQNTSIESALNNEFFTSACHDWRERLMDGDLTPESQLKQKSEYEKHLKAVDTWKMKNFEEVWGARMQSAEELLEQKNEYERAIRALQDREPTLSDKEAKVEIVRLEDQLYNESMKDESSRKRDFRVDYSGIVANTCSLSSPSTSAAVSSGSLVDTSIVKSEPSQVGEADAKSSVTQLQTPAAEEEDTSQLNKVAILLPHLSSTVQQVINDHGLPLGANQRRKCNSQLPPSLCLSAKRISLNAFAPPSCFLNSPIMIPRRRKGYFKHINSIERMRTMAKSVAKSRLEREAAALREHLAKARNLIENPPLMPIHVPYEVMELLSDVLNLVDNDRIHEYATSTHSYATSTIGTPSHAGTTIDENFGSELMFSVATDEEPPTDMSDDAIGSEISESRPQTANDNSMVNYDDMNIDALMTATDVNPIEPMATEESATTALAEASMVSEDDTREAITPDLQRSADHENTLNNTSVSEMCDIEKRNELIDECDVECERPCEPPVEDLANTESAVTESEDVPVADEDDDEKVDAPQMEILDEVGEKVDESEVEDSEVVAGESEEKSDMSFKQPSTMDTLMDSSVLGDSDDAAMIRMEILDETAEPEIEAELVGEPPPKLQEHETTSDPSQSPDCIIIDEVTFSNNDTSINMRVLSPEITDASDMDMVITDEVCADSEAPVASPPIEGAADHAISGESAAANTNSELAAENTEVDADGVKASETEAELPPAEKKEDSVLSASCSQAGNLLDLPEDQQRLVCDSMNENSECDLAPCPSGGIKEEFVKDLNKSIDETNLDLMKPEDAENWASFKKEEEQTRTSTSSPTTDATLSDDDTDIDNELTPNMDLVDQELSMKNSESGSDCTIEDGNVTQNITDDSATTLDTSTSTDHSANNSLSTLCSGATTPNNVAGGSPVPPSQRSAGSSHADDDKSDALSGRPATFITGSLVPPPLPPRCRAQASGYSNRRRRRALSCRDLLIAVEQRKKGQQTNGSPCCMRLNTDSDTNEEGCYCKLQPMLPCTKCGGYWHSDCIGPSRICSTCLLV